MLIFLTGIFVLVSANKINIETTNYNNPPNPPVIEGPTEGKIKETQVYYITVTDPDEDDKLLKLEVDFGDGIISEDCGCNIPWENGEIIEMEHIWKNQGNYQVKARVADASNVWSEWSEPLSVIMPKNRIFSSNFPSLLYKIFLFFHFFSYV
jgi:hypothetical protein